VEFEAIVKTAVSGLAFVELPFAVMGRRALDEPAGMVIETGMSPWGRR
jgi:hypothetical protein